MNAPPTDGLQFLVISCHQASQRYQSAARAVGDPGLRLQFKHLAAARGEMGAALGVAAGVSAAAAALGAPEPPSLPPLSPPKPGGRVPLGGEDERAPLDKDELCALVRALREHDESMLHAVGRLRGEVTTELAAALDRAAHTLHADLEKMRLLEDLAADVSEPVRPR